MTQEAETAALREFVEPLDLLASELVVTEVPRGLRRVPGIGEWSEDWLILRQRLRLTAVDRSLLQAAADVVPGELRSLDAVHLASALSVATAIDGVIVYDRRLAQACVSQGLTVMSPGR